MQSFLTQDVSTCSNYSSLNECEDVHEPPTAFDLISPRPELVFCPNTNSDTKHLDSDLTQT